MKQFTIIYCSLHAFSILTIFSSYKNIKNKYEITEMYTLVSFTFVNQIIKTFIFLLQIIRRSGVEEKYLCVVRQRPGHFCETACIVAVLVAWEGVPQPVADDLYQYLRTTLPTNGFETERRCGTNER